jgi:hypothetical protein
VNFSLGRASAQAVSRRLPTAAARVLSQVRSCGIFGVQSDTGVGYFPELWFPLPILISANSSYASINRRWYNMPISGRRTTWALSHPHEKNYSERSKVNQGRNHYETGRKTFDGDDYDGYYSRVLVAAWLNIQP